MLDLSKLGSSPTLKQFSEAVAQLVRPPVGADSSLSLRYKTEGPYGPELCVLCNDNDVQAYLTQSSLPDLEARESLAATASAASSASGHLQAHVHPVILDAPAYAM